MTEECLQSKEILFEYVDEDGNYVKAVGKKVQCVGFWLRFVSEHFIPCKECQKKLLRIIRQASELHLGNDNKPPIELYKKYEIDDDSWVTLEKRKATADEIKRL